MSTFLIEFRRLAPMVIAMVGLVLSAGLGGCGSRTTTGAVLHAGESATVRLTGSPVAVEITNIGDQALEYTLAENGVQTERGVVTPGNHVAESRHADEILVTITNPGPGLGHASVEARSRHGMEFRQPATQTAP